MVLAATFVIVCVIPEVGGVFLLERGLKGRTFIPLERSVPVCLPLYSLAHLELFPFDGIL